MVLFHKTFLDLILDNRNLSLSYQKRDYQSSLIVIRSRKRKDVKSETQAKCKTITLNQRYQKD